jgi:ABC-2 type transport system ATP-binding protein
MSSLVFRYPGAKRDAINVPSLTIPAGATGIIGPNGAGKTTIFQMITGALPAQKGELLIGGQQSNAYRKANPIGLTPDRSAFDPYLTVREFLTGLSERTHHQHPSRPRFGELTPADLSGIMDSRLGTLSLGEGRRVELAAALIGDPELVLLDEPTNGLDPVAVAQLRDSVLNEVRADRTLVVASHHLDELQRVVDRVVVLVEGSVVGVWEREAAIAQYGSFDRLFEVVVRSAAPQLYEPHSSRGAA